LALRTEPTSRPAESLSGLIERVTFFNEENGFGVLRSGNSERFAKFLKKPDAPVRKGSGHYVTR
jgi:hypothetical protein